MAILPTGDRPGSTHGGYDQAWADAIHARLGNGWWPARWAGVETFHLDERKDRESARRILVSYDREIAGRERGGGVPWVHASISRIRVMPSYADLKLLHAAVFGDGWAYQCFTPPAEHVNLHEFVLHLFGRADGAPVLPDFTHRGEI